MTAEPSIVSGVAGRYANALFDLAGEQKAIDDMLADLGTLAAMIAGSDDLSRMIRSPVVARADQAGAMAEVLSRAGIEGLVAKFVGTVAVSGRLSQLPAMIRQYEMLVFRHRGEVNARVTSARPLDQGQLAAIENALAAAVGREVQLSAEVDAKVLGGLVVQVGSRMVDSSLRTQLNNLQFALKEVG